MPRSDEKSITFSFKNKLPQCKAHAKYCTPHSAISREKTEGENHCACNGLKHKGNMYILSFGVGINFNVEKDPLCVALVEASDIYFIHCNRFSW